MLSADMIYFVFLTILMFLSAYSMGYAIGNQMWLQAVACAALFALFLVLRRDATKKLLGELDKSE